MTTACIIDLPFVSSQNGRPINLWVTPETGEYSLDTAFGRQCADAVLDYMAQSENPTILGKIVRDMILGGRYGAVEVGFIHRIAEVAVRPKTPVEA